MNTEQELQDLKNRFDALEQEYFTGNFTAHQDFQKTVFFNSRLKIPVVTALPATCEIGELVSYGGKLYHASALNTWTAQTP